MSWAITTLRSESGLFPQMLHEWFSSFKDYESNRSIRRQKDHPKMIISYLTSLPLVAKINSTIIPKNNSEPKEKPKSRSFILVNQLYKDISRALVRKKLSAGKSNGGEKVVGLTDMIIYNRVYLHLEKCYVLSRALVKVKLRLDAWSMHRKGPILNFKLTVRVIRTFWEHGRAIEWERYHKHGIYSFYLANSKQRMISFELDQTNINGGVLISHKLKYHLYGVNYMEQRASLPIGVTVEFYGGELNGINYNDPAAVKKYARRAELGESKTCPSTTITFLFWNSSPISPRLFIRPFPRL
ncbi:hypothetical protein G4B88_020261 [Cannabis sativa]|uniref:Uncharacterized protein n=1 Tax=Cannabis sativa TaxID=3483 RepID=A0A7J6DNI3_CANSA|nr:hypothetical protein G4B88_020261 [Cannabis sativa]